MFDTERRGEGKRGPQSLLSLVLPRIVTGLGTETEQIKESETQERRQIKSEVSSSQTRNFDLVKHPNFVLKFRKKGYH